MILAIATIVFDNSPPISWNVKHCGLVYFYFIDNFTKIHLLIIYLGYYEIKMFDIIQTYVNAYSDLMY